MLGRARWNAGRSGAGFGPCLVVALSIATAPAARADESEWSIAVEPVYVQVFGHDQHVLTVHQLELDGTPASDDRTAVSLDTDDAFAYRGEFRYGGGGWTWGLDFFWFVTTQGAPALTDAAGTADAVAFEVADRTFTSTRPNQVLYYELLEDTDLEFWTVDLYGLRTVAEGADTELRVQLGLRLGDFDNDYRAVVGVRDVGGLRMDASSNYDRLMGPLVGVAGEIRFGRQSLEGYLGQSVLLGTADKLVSMQREFDGPFSESPTFTSRETFGKVDEDVALPITEVRIRWSWQLNDLFTILAGTQASAWWDVPVPPGVVPGEDGDERFHEATVVAVGLSAGVKLTF